MIRYLLPKGLLLLSCLILLSPETSGQKKASDLFHAGKDAVFIDMGPYLVSSANPKENISSYRIDKTLAGKNKWSVIAEVEAPSTLNEFKERLVKFNKYFPEPTQIADLPVDTIWEKLNRTRDLDSIRTMAAYIPFRLAAGISYVDTDVLAESTYEYRIYYKKNNTWELQYFSDPVKYPTTVSFAPIIFYKKFTTSSVIDITYFWENGKRPGYLQLLRRDNFDGSFNSIKAEKVVYTKNDTAFFNIQDVNIKENTPYEYIVVQFDLYGNKGNKSDTLTVASDNIIEVARPAKIHTRNQQGIEGLIIGWEVPNPKKTVGLKLFRSTDYDTGYQLLAELTGADTMFVDQTALPMQRYYYYFTLNGLLGEVSGQSAKVFGIYQSTLPILPPIMVKAEPAAKGVRVSWRPGDDHVRGYYVFRGDQQQMEQITPLIYDTVYSDTSNILSGREVYAYSIIAEGLSYQRSVPSDTVFVNPRGNEMVLSPKGMVTRISNEKVYLIWDDMEENDENIIAYIVYRKENNEQWKQISNPPVEHNYFIDSLVQQGHKYQYTAKSVSLTGKLSELGMTASAEVTQSVASLQPPSELTAYKSKDQVTLRWNGVSQPEIEGFKLYRSESGKPAELLQTVDKDTYEIKDTSVRPGILYAYSISSYDKNKNESKVRTSIRVVL